MKFLLMICLYVCVCTASDNDVENVQPSAPSFSSMDFETLITFEIFKDCDRLSKIHKNCDSAETFESETRAINDGLFPLSRQVKLEIADALVEKFDNSEDAVEFLDKLERDYKLYPLSVQKIKDLIGNYRKNSEFDYDQGIKNLERLAMYAEKEEFEPWI